MKKKIVIIAIAATAILGFLCTENAISRQTPQKSLTSTTLDDQESVALTIYNVNLGLVKDIRGINLFKGRGELQFMDVASRIIPTSVHIKSLTEPGSLSVLEQNYEYDLLNPQKLMEKYVGKKVKLFYKNPYTEREEIVTATLLSNNGGPIYKIGEEITFGYPGRVIFPNLPENLISKPTLIWSLDNDLRKEQTIEASYLTNGINWSSDYVVTLNEKDTMADMTGWVTINNKSGATYKNAKLKLVAGDVNRVRNERVYSDRMLRYAAKEASSAKPQFKEEGFFEYHIYTLTRPATVKQNQTKQISLIRAAKIPVKKELLFQGFSYYFRGRYGEMVSNQKVGVYVEIDNRKKNNLGIPLPKGKVRVYKNDHEGNLQFVGEDLIDHTPKDEKVRVKMGEAFDVVGGRKQTDWKKIAYDTYEAGYEVSLRNHKKEGVTVRVVEPIPGDWKILSSSHKYEKTEGHTAQFKVRVPKDKEVKITYRVRMKF